MVFINAPIAVLIWFVQIPPEVEDEVGYVDLVEVYPHIGKAISLS